MKCVLCVVLCILLEIVTATFQNESKDFLYTEHYREKRQSCRTSEFQCLSGNCIDKTSVCDGAKDCFDGSDETDSQCGTTRCPSYVFRCDYGACVDALSKCNGVEDCADGSDENKRICRNTGYTNCKPKEFQCDSGSCIDDTLLCDGARDCKDGSDETARHCRNFRCPPYTFRCSYGACVDGKARCNGEQQCADSSDEDPAICKQVPVIVNKPVCRLPKPPENGKIKILNCKDSDVTPYCLGTPNTVVPNWTFLEFHCNEGYNMAGTNTNPCVEGQWSNPHPTCVPVLCPPLESDNLEISCIFKREKVPCEKPLAPGSEATLDCKVAYQLTFEPGYNKIHCLENGKWDKPLFTCTQECGRRNPEGKPLLSNGLVAKVGEFPWLIGIYRKSGEDWEQICSGSLINPNTVISAAHCFWNEVFSNKMDTDQFRVAAGKYYRDWKVKDLEMQERELSNIILPENYKGRKLDFSNDIAILKLNVSVELSWAVLPVCIDWQNKFGRFHLSNGNMGATAGWGITEKNEPSDVLVTSNLPFVDFQKCWSTVPEVFQKYLGKDKFCAGYLNGTSVCPGDSGGGLVFETQKKYYLQGIVSMGLEPLEGSQCFTDQYTTFTKVLDFLSWMQNYIR